MIRASLLPGAVHSGGCKRACFRTNQARVSTEVCESLPETHQSSAYFHTEETPDSRGRQVRSATEVTGALSHKYRGRAAAGGLVSEAMRRLAPCVPRSLVGPTFHTCKNESASKLSGGPHNTQKESHGPHTCGTQYRRAPHRREKALCKDLPGQKVTSVGAEPGPKRGSRFPW